MNLLLKDYLDRQVTPVASRLERESKLLFEAFQGLGDHGLLIPKVPESMGGLGLDTPAFWQYQSLMARHSGTLAFLQTQHQSAASFLRSSENKTLVDAYLPAMATGAKRLGVGFSQLRRQPSPLQAVQTSGGYRLNGEVPWVSGAGLFTAFIGAAALADGSSVFGLLPLSNIQGEGGQVSVSEPMKLMAMASTETVSVTLKDYFLAEEQVLGLRPAGWIEGRDRESPLSPLGLILGCAQSGLDVAGRSLSKRQLEHSVLAQLQAQIAQIWTELPERYVLPGKAYAQKVALRGRAIALMNACAQTALLAASGAANRVGHSAQRVYKEALVFSVSGQSNESAIASLDAISKSLYL